MSPSETLHAEPHTEWNIQGGGERERENSCLAQMDLIYMEMILDQIILPLLLVFSSVLTIEA